MANGTTPFPPNLRPLLVSLFRCAPLVPWWQTIVLVALAVVVAALFITTTGASSGSGNSQFSQLGVLATDQDTPTVPIILSSQPGDWPMYGHDISRTNYDPDETTLNKNNVNGLVSLWQADIGYGTQPTSSTPSVANGKVYVGSSVLTGSNFLSFDAVTGSLDWGITLGHSQASCFGVGIGATSAISDNIAVVGGADGAYYGINSEMGTLLWRDPIGGGPSGYPWASPLTWSGRAYIGVSSGCDNPAIQGGMQAVDLNTGSLLQSQTFVPEGKAGADIWNSPVLSPDGKRLGGGDRQRFRRLRRRIHPRHSHSRSFVDGDSQRLQRGCSQQRSRRRHKSGDIS